MHTRVVQAAAGPELIVRPLRTGDTATVQAAFERLGQASRGRASTATGPGSVSRSCAGSPP